jgi:hypothetical protein
MIQSNPVNVWRWLQNDDFCKLFVNCCREAAENHSETPRYQLLKEPKS